MIGLHTMRMGDACGHCIPCFCIGDEAICISNINIEAPHYRECKTIQIGSVDVRQLDRSATCRIYMYGSYHICDIARHVCFIELSIEGLLFTSGAS
jgi:hypothetical protein